MATNHAIAANSCAQMRAALGMPAKPLPKPQRRERPNSLPTVIFTLHLSNGAICTMVKV